jgi:hypothetical protein
MIGKERKHKNVTMALGADSWHASGNATHINTFNVYTGLVKYYVYWGRYNL